MAGQGKSGNFGNCEGCRFFGRDGQGGEERTCTQAQLQKFDLKVTAHSGCNQFSPAGTTQTIEEGPSAPSVH